MLVSRREQGCSANHAIHSISCPCTCTTPWSKTLHFGAVASDAADAGQLHEYSMQPMGSHAELVSCIQASMVVWKQPGSDGISQGLSKWSWQMELACLVFWKVSSSFSTVSVTPQGHCVSDMFSDINFISGAKSKLQVSASSAAERPLKHSRCRQCSWDRGYYEHVREPSTHHVLHHLLLGSQMS